MSDHTADPTILTTSEAAKFLRMSPAKLRDLVGASEIASFKVGPRLRFRRQDLLTWLNKQLEDTPTTEVLGLDACAD